MSPLSSIAQDNLLCQHLASYSNGSRGARLPSRLLLYLLRPVPHLFNQRPVRLFLSNPKFLHPYSLKSTHPMFLHEAVLQDLHPW
jgi:hypothetical protein